MGNIGAGNSGSGGRGFICSGGGDCCVCGGGGGGREVSGRMALVFVIVGVQFLDKNASRWVFLCLS